jgi:hypothetical protein
MLNKFVFRGILSISLVFLAGFSFAQEDLEDLLNEEMGDITHYTTGTFKASRIIHGHSVEQMQKGGLDFRVAHRFGHFSEGFYELFGLDYASSYFSLEYGIIDRLVIGAGRETYNKNWNGFMKVKILRQAEGAKFMPISLSWCSNLSVNGIKYSDKERQQDFNSRMAYTHQLLVARKFGPKLSFQVSPTYVHRNLVKVPEQNNDLFAIGAGGRYLFFKRIGLVAEYYHVFGLENDYLFDYFNPLAIGLDIQVSGHVFQLHVTNAEPMTESAFIGETTSGFFNGGLRFGFNIATVFSLD